MGAVVIIPARLGASRLPNKPLVELAKLPLIVHTWRQATKSGCDQVVVAADDPTIVEAITEAGGEARLTAPDHASGTDRVAEVARTLSHDIVVNLQGDEPFIDPRDIDQLVAALQTGNHDIATLQRPLAQAHEHEDPNVVKVSTDAEGNAVRFSRSSLDHAKRHLGVYAYQRRALEAFCAAPPSPDEKIHRLEQLRALDLGLSIRVLDAHTEARGIDTPEDLDRARERVQSLGPSAFPGAA